jgi:hypothetical protein
MREFLLHSEKEEKEILLLFLLLLHLRLHLHHPQHLLILYSAQ